MRPERWKQIQEKLDIAVALCPDEREIFLRQLGDSDLELRQEVESLLSFASSEPKFLETPAVHSLMQVDWQETKNEFLRGRVLGPYRVGALLGAGGMGDVYRGERVDGQYEQQVAIKVVRSPYARGLAARFRNERQILASLEHPNIARILDGGVSEDGIPFLVMELIEGLPITEYCQQHMLPIDDRLKLFRTICAAVHYAHQHLVVHRDIKPANILVTADGTPKLLDFGIAKILRSDLEQTGTRTGLLIMTPEYASPEQLRGEPVTTATDLYSLGLVLYEVLTGLHAFHNQGKMPHQIARGVLETEPERPSEAVRQISHKRQSSGDNSVGLLLDSVPNNRLLQGDLDSIVLKALCKDPTARYSSADQLSEDIRRHLQGLPVMAREGTLSYRLSKYLLRHKTGVATTALIFLVLIAGIALTLREAHIAKRNEVRADRRFNDVRKLANSLLFEIHDAVKDLPGSTPTRKLIVQDALQYLDSLSSEARGDPSLQRELATAYERVGEVQGHFLLGNLGETENALHSYQKAHQLRKEIASSQGSSWQDQLSVARCSRLVSVQLQAMGNVREALENIQSAISLAESAHRQHPTEDSILDELSREYEIDGYLHRGGGVLPAVVDIEVQRDSFRKAIAIDEEWLNLVPDSDEAKHSLVWNQMDLADTFGAEQPQASLRSYENALEMAKGMAEHSTSIQRTRDVAVVYNKIGGFYDNIGDYANSIKSHQNAFAIYEDLVHKDPQNKQLIQGLAIGYSNVAECLAKMRKAGESKEKFSKAITLMEGLVRDNPENASQQIILARMHAIRAETLRHSNDPAGSLADYKFALKTFSSFFEKDNNTGPRLNAAGCDIAIAKVELQLHHAAAASTSFRDALEALKPLISNDKRDPGISYMAAQAYAGLGRIEAVKAVRASPADAQAHWVAARDWLNMSLEQLAKLSSPISHSVADIDVEPIDLAEIQNELQRCEAALRS